MPALGRRERVGLPVITFAIGRLQPLRHQERLGRWLKLVSGLVVAGLAAVLLFAPDWLM